MRTIMASIIIKEPPLTIGMPVFNGEAYIREAIDSLLNQTYRDFELVISDNASTDSTASICQEYAALDSRVRCIRQHMNIGGVANFRFVLEAAQASQYFMWAACDDSWSPNWVATLIESFKPDDMALFGGYREGGGGLVHPPTYGKNSYARFFLDSDVTGKCLYSYAIYRREILLRSEMRFYNCPIGGDQVLLLHMLKFGGLRSVPGGVLNYRVHSASMSSQQSGTRDRLKTVISRYPFAYYRMAYDAMSPQTRLIAPILIVWKYIKEQTPIALGLFRSLFRRVSSLLRL